MYTQLFRNAPFPTVRTKGGGRVYLVYTEDKHRVHRPGFTPQTKWIRGSLWQRDF